MGLSSEGGGVISVTVPRNLRGRSEILVFLADQPVRGVVYTSYISSHNVCDTVPVTLGVQ